MEKTIKSLILSIVVGILIFQIIGSVKADVIVPGYHNIPVNNKITNIGDYPDYYFIIFSQGPVTNGPFGENINFVEDDGAIDLLGTYKLAAVNVYAIKKTDFEDDNVREMNYEETRAYLKSTKSQKILENMEHSYSVKDSSQETEKNNTYVVSIDSDIVGCTNFYWIDNTNKSCGQKQFCGMYMYFGLQTFESKEQCLKAVNKTVFNCPIYTPPLCENGEEIAPAEMDKNGCLISICRKKCPLNTDSENNLCYKNLSNGRKAEIKIMPQTASETAIERLGELNFTIELKEVGANVCKIEGQCQIPVYELTGNKQGKFLGIIKTTGKLKIQVDAQTGEVVYVKKPWWAFLATRI